MIITLPLFYSTQYAAMATLLTLQLVEMVRLWVVWPFLSSFRNWFRLSLETALMFFFLVNIIQIKLLNDI